MIDDSKLLWATGKEEALNTADCYGPLARKFKKLFSVFLSFPQKVIWNETPIRTENISEATDNDLVLEVDFFFNAK